MLHHVTQERIRVRYGETDPMGHAYYANYLFWFEQARVAWCRARGFSYRDMEALGYFLPVVEAHAAYRGEVLFDDVVTVRVWATEKRRASIRFEYEIVNERTGRTTTTGHTWHVVMSKERKAVSIPPEVRALFEAEPNAEGA